MKKAADYLWNVVKWLALSAVLGGVCGVLGAGFHRAIELAAALREAHRWVIALLPLGGVVTLLLYRACRVSLDAGTDLVITSISENTPVPALLAPLIVVGATLSHLFGASVGREGAALQLGGSLGHNLGKLLRLEPEDVRLCAMCGMAGCFSAMFGTPLAAAIFVLEVARVGAIRYGALLPCLTASYAAHLAALALGAEPMAFPLAAVPELSGGSLARVAALAAGCALVGLLLCVALKRAGALAKKYLPNPYLRVALGGAVMAALVLGFGLYDYAGAGGAVIARAVAGQTEPWAFALKLALTALCVAAGYRGGEIVPTLFIGATFGCAAAPLVGLAPGFGACVGMIALFCSVVNCPVASLFLAAELFSTGDLALFSVAVAVAYVLSGYAGLYASQRIQFTKLGDRARD